MISWAISVTTDAPEGSNTAATARLSTLVTGGTQGPVLEKSTSFDARQLVDL